MIKRLSPEVRDQIAAGEVVERPAHLVKELIENSLDAGATKIHVKVAGQARTLLVTDNGKGIRKQDLELAIERFATSKIEITDDLWKLKSFGFRGEALASAASISRLRLTSREKGARESFQIESAFGKNGPVVSASLSEGTEIFISDLFENVPARLKFLKSETAENMAIRNVIKSFALAHANVEFKYFENDRLLFMYQPCDSWKDRCQQVLDMDSALFETTWSEQGWKADLVFADPQNVAKTAKQMWFFVQDRWVQDRSLQAAVTDAYRSLLMHGEYPIVVVKLQVPTEDVDVNIHPTKSQVKFLNPSQAFRTVHHVLKAALDRAPWLSMQLKTPNPTAPTEKTENQLSWASQTQEWDRVQYKKRPDPQFFQEPTQVLQPIEAATGVWSRLDVIGQLGLTYIVTQSDEGLMLIDQHAAHERVAFERLMKAYREGGLPTQEFLFPLILDLTPLQVETLSTHLQDFEKLGLKLEVMGPQSLSLSSAPLFMKESSLPSLFARTADEIHEWGGSFQFSKKLIDICATFACHSVVRAGQSLSIAEMRSLLHQMDEFPHSSFCPHGRPVSVRWSLAELEREFGRRA